MEGREEGRRYGHKLDSKSWLPISHTLKASKAPLHTDVYIGVDKSQTASRGGDWHLPGMK